MWGSLWVQVSQDLLSRMTVIFEEVAFNLLSKDFRSLSLLDSVRSLRTKELCKFRLPFRRTTWHTSVASSVSSERKFCLVFGLANGLLCCIECFTPKGIRQSFSSTVNRTLATTNLRSLPQNSKYMKILSSKIISSSVYLYLFCVSLFSLCSKLRSLFKVCWLI